MSSIADNINQQDVELIIKVVTDSDFSVSRFKLERYSEENLGFLAMHHRLTINVKYKGNNDESCEEIVCFVKMLPFENPAQLDYIQNVTVFDKETAFFNKIVPLLAENYVGPNWCAKCYLVKDSALCFEDLALQGFKMPDKLLNEMQIRSALRTVASLHANSINFEWKLKNSLNAVFSDCFHEVVFLKKNRNYKWFTTGVTLTIMLAEKMGLTASQLPKAFERVFTATQPSKINVNVINHGDLWSNNMLFDDNGQCRLVDFQNYRYCPPGCDIAQLLYLCAPNVLRKSKEEELVKYYYHQLLEFLEEECSRMFSFEDIFQNYQEQKIVGCITAVLYFPTILLDGIAAREICDSSDGFDHFLCIDRSAKVIEIMEKDPVYKERLEAGIRELVEMSSVLNDLPLCC